MEAETLGFCGGKCQGGSFMGFDKIFLFQSSVPLNLAIITLGSLWRNVAHLSVTAIINVWSFEREVVILSPWFLNAPGIKYVVVKYIYTKQGVIKI